MKKSNKNIVLEVIKRSRKQSREEEIKLHGKPVKQFHITKSGKIYNRRQNKNIEI
jgi:hypothetical protein